MSMPSEDEHSFISKHDNQTKMFVTYRSLVFQWKHSGETDVNREIYCVKVIGFNDTWKSLGIHHVESYVNIMKTNPVWAYAEVTLYKKDTMQYEENQTMIKQAGDGSAPSGSVRGYYTFSIDNIVPDYLAMLPCTGLNVSIDWVKDKFSDYVGSQGKGASKRDTLTLKPSDSDASKAFHKIEGGIKSSVLSIGHPNHHGFDGDVWSELDARDCYVLTGAQLTEDAPVGSRTDKTESEAYLDNLINTIPGLSWWVFAVKPSAVEYARVKVERPAKLIKREQKTEDHDEQAAEADVSPQPMEVEEDEKDRKVEEHEEEDDDEDEEEDA